MTMTSTSNILVFGAGGVGLIYAALLQRGGCSVTTVCRSNFNAVKTNGIYVKSVRWGDIRTRPNVVRDCHEAKAFGPFDYALISSKCFPGTADLVKDAITPERTAIVLAQNGIDIEEDYAKLYPTNPIISGVVYLPATQTEPGVAMQMTPLEEFEIGTYPHDAPKSAKDAAVRFSELFAAGEATAPVHDDIQIRRWNKVALNACFNPITALTLCDDANFLRSSEFAPQMARDVMKEVASIASAVGYPHAVSEEEIEHHMERHLGRLKTGGKEPSMLVDIHQGRNIEVEAILGNTVRIADSKGLHVPYLKMLYVLAKGRDFAVLKSEESGWKPIATVS